MPQFLQLNKYWLNIFYYYLLRFLTDNKKHENPLSAIEIQTPSSLISQIHIEQHQINTYTYHGGIINYTPWYIPTRYCILSKLSYGYITEARNDKIVKYNKYYNQKTANIGKN